MKNSERDETKQSPENDGIRARILSLIDLNFDSDAAFERAANLPPKTVSNWRRGKSSSYLRLLETIAPLFGIHAADFLLDSADTDDGEKRLLHLWRRTEQLSVEERSALLQTISEIILLYLTSHREETN